MKKNIAAVAALFTIHVLLFTCSAQDMHFSQPAMTPLMQNPALAGANYDMQAIANYKSQWTSVSSPFKTYGISVDRRLYDRTRGRRSKKGFWAAGLDVYSDKAGDGQMGTLQANLCGAYHIKLDFDNTLATGMMLGYMQRSINPDELQWMNQYDGMKYRPDLPSYEVFDHKTKGVPDVGAGVEWAYNKGEAYMTGNDHQSINAGVAVYHPHQPEYGFLGESKDNLHVRWVGHANATLGIANTNLSVAPGIFYYHQGSTDELTYGSLLRYVLRDDSKFTGYIRGSAVSLGAYYRNKDAVIVQALIEVSEYALGISYDVNTSDLNSASHGVGGFEISLRWVQWRWFYYKKV